MLIKPSASDAYGTGEKHHSDRIHHAVRPFTAHASMTAVMLLSL